MRIKILLNSTVFIIACLLVSCNGGVTNISDDNKIIPNVDLEVNETNALLKLLLIGGENEISVDELGEFNLFDESELITYQNIAISHLKNRENRFFEFHVEIDCFGGGECQQVYLITVDMEGKLLAKKVIFGIYREEFVSNEFVSKRVNDSIFIYRLEKSYDTDSEQLISTDTISKSVYLIDVNGEISK